MLAVIATEIAVLAASGTAADAAAARALEAALSARGLTVITDPIGQAERAGAVLAAEFGPLGRARQLLSEAERHDLQVELPAAEQAIAEAVRGFESALPVGGVREELADALLVRGAVAFHRGDLDAARGFFARARRLCDRVLTGREVHPDLARLYREAGAAEGISEPAPTRLPPALSPADVADVLWLDAVAVVRGGERRAGPVAVATRYDRAQGRWTDAVAGEVKQVAAALSALPALAAAPPELTIPADPPLPAPPRFYRRGWFWTLAVGAAAAAAGSLLAIDAARTTHTTITAPPNTFRGWR